MNRNEILENRKKVIEFLKDSRRKKCIGKLEDSQDSEKRCCLGHMCAALNVPRMVLNNDVLYDGKTTFIPESAMQLIGLYSHAGGSPTGLIIYGQYYHTLVTINDTSTTSPQKIGEYLESVIKGGPNTPWKSLDEYKD